MKDDLKAKWVEALRSNAYLQGRDGFLEKDGAYCCLGVLCKIAGAKMPHGQYPAYFDEEANTNLEELGPNLLSYFDIGYGVEATLIEMNDQLRASFPAIADWIEAHDLKTGKALTQATNGSGS